MINKQDSLQAQFTYMDKMSQMEAHMGLVDVSKTEDSELKENLLNQR